MGEKSIADRYTVVAGLASAVAQHAQTYGIDIKPICAALELDPAQFQSLTARVSLDRLCRLLEACAVLANDDAFGLKCAQRFVAGASGPFGYGLISAPTVKDFLVFLEAHTQYATHTNYFKAQYEADVVRMEWSFAPLIVKRDQFVDMSIALTIQRLHAIVGDRIDLVGLEMERPRPKQLPLFRDLIVKQLRFDCRFNTIIVPNSLLGVKNPKGDQRLFTLMDMQCRAMRPDTTFMEQDFVAQVRDYLALRISEPILSLKDIAAYFGISERTFQRRLTENDTNLNLLRDTVRREMSLELLQASDLPINEISYRLGYSAPSAFTRSVTRWFGATPSTLREAKSA